jgi:hypothetical protein
LLLGRKAGDGKSGRQSTAEVEATDESNGYFGVGFGKEKNLLGTVLIGPKDIGQEKGGVAARSQSCGESSEIGEGFEGGGGKEFAKKGGEIRRGFWILLGEENRGHDLSWAKIGNGERVDLRQ